MLLALGLPALAGAQTSTFKYWDVTAPDSLKRVPETLSATGLYTGTSIRDAKKILLASAYHFEVNSALWSDGAHKTRWVMLKDKSKAAIKYAEKEDYWGYPDSAVFIKQFAIDTVPNDSNTRLLWETRFLVNRKEIADSATGRKMDRWYGYSYKWNRDQKDAVLVGASGMDDSIKIFPNGLAKPGIQKKWRFPSREQCLLCHRNYSDTVAGRSVLGFFTAQLNRPHPDMPNVNQLEYFFTQGVLKGTKSNWTASTTPRWYPIDDNSASVDVRARSYIAANCSGCHGYRGMETGATFGVDLNYDFHTMESKMEFRHKSTGWPFGLDTLPPFYYPKTDLGNNPFAKDSLEIRPALVVPGYPEKSVILFRQRSRNTNPGNYDSDRNQMPPLASFEVNEPATALIAKWIKDWTPIPAPGATGVRTWNVRTLLKGPGIANHQVVLPMELAGPGLVKVSLTGIDGRTLQLTQQSRTAYALPANLTPGVYIIRVNNRSFTRYLF
ncbi:MAG TPA: T9SS type A sorting domain-containing protein [Fibrobacteria bacterium]|nr:T9SS type A sorting domain-containing protein [Fibrobacteria bacterium]